MPEKIMWENRNTSEKKRRLLPARLSRRMQGGGGGSFRLATPTAAGDDTIAVPLTFGSRMLLTGAANFQKAASLNAGLYVRRQWAWSAVEPTEGATYNWSSLDTPYANAAAAGIKLMGNLASAPAWATGGAGQGNHYPVGFVANFAAFCGAAAARYPNVLRWEIMNEPDADGWTAAQVKEVLIACYDAIKAANPAAQVGGIVMAGIPVSSPFAGTAWRDALFQDAAVQSHLDAVSFHYYAAPDEPENGSSVGNPHIGMHTQLISNEAYFASVGWTKPMWYTEFGWPTENGLLSQTSEEDQARWLPRAILIAASFGIRMIVQFQLYGSNTPGDRAGGMGLINIAGDDKPSWQTVKTVMGLLDSTTKTVTRQKTSPYWLVRWDKTGGRWGYALWVVTTPVSVTLTGLPSVVRHTTQEGVQTLLTTSAGSLTLTAGVNPAYIEVVW